MKWKDSQARRLLYNDVQEGLIPLDAKYDDGTPTMTLQEIYISRADFAAYDYNKFSSRLATIRGRIKHFKERAGADLEAFELFVANHAISHYDDRKGYVQWQGSKSQELAKADSIQAGLLSQGFRTLYNSQEEYFMEYGFKEFSDKI